MGIRRSAAYLSELESLRGVAIALVYAFHTDGLVHFMQIRRPPATLLGALVRRGNTGVDLFFVLSAFLLTLPFVAEADHGRPVALRRYFLRRGLRILPLYWVAVLPVILLTAQNWREIVEVLPLLVLVGAITPPVPRMFPYATVWWSLATEWQFYLLLPLVRWVLRPRVGIWIGLALLSGWASAYCLALRTPSYETDQMTWLFSSLFGRAPIFVFGIVGAVLYVRHGVRARTWLHSRPVMRNGGADVLLVGTCLLLLVLLYAVCGYDLLVSERAPLVVWHVGAGALWALIVALVLVAPLRSRALFCNPLMAWVGTVSYSVYLWHVPITSQALSLVWHRWPGVGHAWDLPTTAIVAMMTAALLVCSWLSYRLIEQPFLRYKAKLE